MIRGSTHTKRSLNEATPPPRGASSSVSWCCLGTDNRSGLACGDLRTTGTGTGLKSGDATGDGFDFFVERDGGGGGGARFWAEAKSE